MPKQHPRGLRERAVRLVSGHRGEYQTEYAATRSITARLGIAAPDTLRRRIRHAEVDVGRLLSSAGQLSRLQETDFLRST